jgi:hypothetical protein
MRLQYRFTFGARRRRSGGGPGGGCARMPVGTHPHLLVVGVGSPIAVPYLVRLGARRGEIRRLRSADQQLSGSLRAGGLLKMSFVHKRQDLPLGYSDIPCEGLILLACSHVYGRNLYLRGRLAATRVRADLSWRRALELAADNREAMHGHGAC